jgi:hypothetical protein
MSLKDDLKREAARRGVNVASRGFRAWMDKFSEKRPRGLVSRVRTFFGIEREEDREARHAEMLNAVTKYINELDRKE